MTAPIASLVSIFVVTADKTANAALWSDRTREPRLAIETVIASTSAIPIAAAPRIAPAAPARSLIARPATTMMPRKMAKPTTDQKAKGLRKAVRWAALLLRPVRHRNVNRLSAMATTVAATSGGATRS